MRTYETSAKIEKPGELHISGVPFQAGTEVEVTIRPAANGGHAGDRVVRLFEALDKARNADPAGPLHREELYDRRVLR